MIRRLVAKCNNAMALLGNTIATVAILVVPIQVFGSISSAHFSPAVTLAFLIRRKIHFHHIWLYQT